MAFRTGRRMYDPTLYESDPATRYYQQPIAAPLVYGQPITDMRQGNDYVIPQRAEIYRQVTEQKRRELSPEEYGLFRRYIDDLPYDVVKDNRLARGWNFNQSTGRWRQSSDPQVLVDVEPKHADYTQPGQQYVEHIKPVKQPQLKSFPPRFPQLQYMSQPMPQPPYVTKYVEFGQTDHRPPPQFVEYMQPAPQPEVIEYVRPRPPQFVEYVTPAPQPVQKVVEYIRPAPSQYVEYVTTTQRPVYYQ